MSTIDSKVDASFEGEKDGKISTLLPYCLNPRNAEYLQRRDLKFGSLTGYNKGKLKGAVEGVLIDTIGIVSIFTIIYAVSK